VKKRNTLKRFTHLLEEFKDTPRPRGHAAGRILSFRALVCPFHDYFTNDMEQAWFRWFHETEVGARLPRRLPRQIMLFALLTVVEYVVMVTSGTCLTEHELWRQHRLLAFVTFRGLVFAILGTWWRMVAKHMQWLRFKPALVQWALIFSQTVIGLCTLLSYDTLTQPDAMVECTERLVCQQKLEESARRSARAGLTGECWALVFAVVYSFWMTWHSQLFHQSCFVVVFTAAVMVVAGMEVFSNNFYLSLEARSCFVLCFVIQANIAYVSEAASRSRYKTLCALESMDERIEDILHTLLPQGVVEELRTMPANALSHYYKEMTVVQSDLVGFTRLASACQPSRVVEIVSSIFGRFDELTDKYGIYKVETVGDAYIAGQAEWPLTDDNSPVSVVLFALEMVQATMEWSLEQQVLVSCRVGVHTGECIGGIVGTEMQRYHLFGALMHQLELLESTAPDGRVHVSWACCTAAMREMHEKGTELTLRFEERPGPQLSTSKGDVVQYHQIGGPTYLAVR